MRPGAGRKEEELQHRSSLLAPGVRQQMRVGIASNVAQQRLMKDTPARLLIETRNFPEPVQGAPADIAGHLAALATAGASHLQLVLDPITQATIELAGEVLAELDRPHAQSPRSPSK